VLRFGPETGTLLLHTKRSGVAARVGHDLTLVVAAWSAEVEIPDPRDPSTGRVDATMDLSSIRVRAGSGGAVPLTDRDRREIEGNTRRLLAVERYPTATFTSNWISAMEAEVTVNGTLSLHGSRAPVVLYVRKVAPQQLRAAASVAQTTFGIKPYSAFLGALKLRDEVSVECQVDLTRRDGEPAT
jgi:polyisoprenoid-binding protein YceI